MSIKPEYRLPHSLRKFILACLVLLAPMFSPPSYSQAFNFNFDWSGLDFSQFIVPNGLSKPSDPNWSPVQPGANSVGVSSGTTDVSGGAFSYSLPIIAPPGRAGMEPQLAITYSSGGGNGMLGVGGSVAGLSAITRCGKNIRLDGANSGVKYDQTDAFCLNGQRLIRISAGSDTANHEYRTQIDGFIRVKSYSYNGTYKGPTYFKAWTKDGQIQEFGNTGDSRAQLGQALVGTTAPPVGLWALNKISDTVGNAITFEYQRNVTNGEHLPTKIAYTGGTVEFAYEPRLDTRSGYVAGFKTGVTQRLKHIVTKSGSTVIRTYTPKYSGANLFYASRMLGITECNGSNECLPSTVFTWQAIEAPAIAWQEVEETTTFYTAGGGEKFTFTGDFNGDGLTDYISLATPTQFYMKLGIGNRVRSAVWRVDSDSGVTPAWGAVDYTYSADFNGDGLADIASFSGNDIHMYLSTGSGFRYENWKMTFSASYAGYTFELDLNVAWGGKDYTWLGDFTGDGRPDIISVSGGNVYVRKGTGTGFEYDTWATTAVWSNVGYNWVGDFNADGRMDIASANGNQVRMHLGTGSGFTYEVWSSGSANWCNAEWATQGDFNGDGLTDLGCPHGSEFRVRLGTGKGFKYESWSTSGSWGSWQWQTATDYNGDGRTDIFSISGQTAYLRLSKGDGLELITFSIPFALGAWQYKQYVDFNGDGIIDIFAPQGNKYHIAYGYHSGQALVEGVSNGLVDTKVSYRRMTGNPDIYEKTNHAVLEDPNEISDSPYIPVNPSIFPMQDVISSSNLVSMLEVETGDNVYNRTYYRYGGMKADAHGYGNLGFAWTSVIDDQSGIKGYTEFNQSWPHNGKPVYSKQSLNGTMLSESSTSYGSKPLNGGKTVFPYVSLSTEKKWGLNGDAAGTTVTKQQNIDSYGNIKTMVVENTHNSQTWRKTTTSTYSNNASKWHLGRLLTASVKSDAPAVASVTRNSSFSYDSTSGLLKTETVQPNTTKQHKTTYGYDSYGNKASVSVAGKDRNGTSLTARSSASSYSGTYAGRFATSSSNAFGHSESRIFDTRFGLPTKLTGPNGLSTNWQYDNWGQKTKEIRADNTSTTISRNWASGCVSKGGDDRTAWCISTQSTGNPESTAHYDKFGRKTRVVSTGFDGRFVFVDTFYDRFGRPNRITRPYYKGEIPAYAYTQRDELGRVTAVTEPGANFTQRTSYTTYNGLTVDETNAKGVSKRTERNAVGQVTKVTDGANRSGVERSTISYNYDAVGSLLKTTDSHGNQVTMSYDISGRKISMSDPDMGTWQYKYNTFGELEWQKDAKNQVVSNAYDTLGRLTARTEAEGTTTWTYDTASKGKGKLKKVSDNTGYKEEYSYDSKGRPASTAVTIPGQSVMSTSLSYNSSNGKLHHETRPNGLQVHYQYNNQGYLESVGSLKSQIQANGDYNSQTLANLLNTINTKIAQNATKASTYYALAAQYETSALNYQAAASDSFLLEAEAEALASAAATLDGIAAELSQEAALHAAEATALGVAAQAHGTTYCGNIYGFDFCYSIYDQMGSSLVDLQAAQQDYAAHKIELATAYADLADQQNAQQATTAYNQSVSAATNALNAAKTAYANLEAQKDIFDTAAVLRLKDAYVDMQGDSTYIYYWKASQYDASGRISEFVHGNGLVTNYDYDQASGHLLNIRTGLGWQDYRDLEYSYDDLDNVSSKNDLINNVYENYSYDALDRLKSSHSTVSGSVNQAVAQTITYNYNAIGNLTYKSNVGNYSYSGARPHAVSNAGGVAYGYDNNGNMTTGDGRTWQWTSFNKPKKITKAGSQVNFLYGPSRARYKQTAKDTNNNVTTTYYVGGGSYERQVAPNGKVTHKNFIKAGGKTVAIIAEDLTNIGGSNVKTYTTKYLHHDAINSVDLITNNFAEAESYQNYRPFGERRAQVFAAGFSSAASIDLSKLHGLVNRGFGGHEELASVGLVHMNGRVYDAKLGRFASADPHIQAAGNTQSYNRYSYVLNNPLKYSDPSGFFFKKLFKALGITKLLSILPPELLMAASIASMLLLGPGGLWLQTGNSVLQGAIAGAVSGFIGSGGNLKAAVIGGITGAAFASIGSVKNGTKLFSKAGMKNVFTHGITGGASSVANGGKFGPGFVSAGASAAMSVGGAFGKLGGVDNAVKAMDRAKNATIAGLVGGTTSVIGGGKFANGAQTAAFASIVSSAAGALSSSKESCDRVCMNKIDGLSENDILRSEAKGSGWKREERDRFHNQGVEAGTNRKYTNSDGREAVFTGLDINVSTAVTGRNGPTYNYGRNDFTHTVLDVIPYYFQGVGPSDQSTFFERVGCTLGCSLE